MESRSNTLLHDLEFWSVSVLQDIFGQCKVGRLISMPSDASARRYYRLYVENHNSYVVVNSPLEIEKNTAFFNIALDWQEKGIRTPTVFAKNLQQGFFLLEDFGAETLLSLLKKDTTEKKVWYAQALSVLHRIQQFSAPKNMTLATFDTAFMQREIDLFDTWVANAFCQQPRTGKRKEAIDTVFERIMEEVKAQPYALMHRDYHSRNLVPVEGTIGVLDFQDAVIGPVTYDIVSLLRDCYIDWPESQIEHWFRNFSNNSPLLNHIAWEQQLRWFDWMGLQRHLKASGIFVRQWIQNKNNQYLSDLPRVFSYMLYVCSKYTELTALGHWLQSLVNEHFSKYPWWVTYCLSE